MVKHKFNYSDESQSVVDDDTVYNKKEEDKYKKRKLNMLIYSCPRCYLQEESLSYPSLCPYCSEIIETPQFAKTKNIPMLDSDKYYRVLGLPFNGKYICIECNSECKVYNIELFY